MQLEPLVEEFLAYMKTERGCSPLTLTAYRSDLRNWLHHLQEEGVSPELEAIKTQHLRSFVAHLSSLNRRPATIARRINGIRSFWNYLVDSEYTERNPCRRQMTPKKEQRLPLYLTPDEVHAILATTEMNHYSFLAIRDLAALSTLVYTGVRRAELLDLTLEDVELEERLLRVRKGKGGKERVIPIVDSLADVLTQYLEARPRTSHDRFFVTREKRPLGRCGLTALFRKAVENSGIDRQGLTLHKLRHSFATMLLQSGCDLVSIQRLLGHNSLETTAIYCHTDMSALRGAVQRLSGLRL